MDCGAGRHEATSLGIIWSDEERCQNTASSRGYIYKPATPSRGPHIPEPIMCIINVCLKHNYQSLVCANQRVSNDFLDGV